MRNIEDYKKKCYSEFGEICFFCNEKDANIIHFIDGDRSNTNIENIRPSCSNCYAHIHDSTKKYIKWSLKLSNPPVAKITNNDLYDAFSETDYIGSTITELKNHIDASEDIIKQSLKLNSDIFKQNVEDNNYVWYVNSEPSENNSIILFPDRREIAVSNIEQNKMDALGRTAHMVDISDGGSLYRIDQEDVWNASHDTFNEYIEDIETVVGDVTPRLRERLKSDWDKAKQFTLKTSPKGYTILESKDKDVFENIAKRKLDFNTHYTQFIDDSSLRVTTDKEASVKQKLYDAGYPVQDYRELESGADINIDLDDELQLRPYQQNWVDKFLERGGGTFVGPPGAGKTIAAIGVIASLGGETLIIVPKRELAQQWEDELLQHTTLKPNQIGQYHGGEKTIAPITIATYDTARQSRHRKLFNERDWHLLVSDECHHLPSPVWKRVSKIQSKARLGLTATPVRESGNAQEIYSLIGPPVGTDWHSLFEDGYVQKPSVEIKHIPWFDDAERDKYKNSKGHAKRQVAAMNPEKLNEIKNIISQEDKTCIIFVEWLDQGKEYSKELDIPFICGETPHKKREKYFGEMKNGDRSNLIISRVGDEGIDIPNADTCIIASTLGSSKAQTAQRIGRTMRPVGASKGYLLATKGSNEEDFILSSTKYLAQQGIQVMISN